MDTYVQSLVACLNLGETDGGDRRQREGDAGHAAIVGPVAVSLQNIGGDSPGVVARYRSKRWPLACRVPGCIDDRVRDAL